MADEFIALARGDGFSLSGDCESPIPVHLTGWDHVSDLVQTREPVKARSPKGEQMATNVRCRKCPACHRHRWNKWAARACTEQAMAERTWFLTLTFGPSSRLRIEALVEQNLRRMGHTMRGAEGFDPIDDRRRYLADEVRREVCKFWKRLRKNTGARVRYFAALEYHKDGWPHIHALLHSGAGDFPDGFEDEGFPKANAIFAAAWGHGFTYTKPVQRDDADKAFYVAKYISKSGGRVSASQLYGRGGNPTLQSGEESTPRAAGPTHGVTPVTSPAEGPQPLGLCQDVSDDAL